MSKKEKTIYEIGYNLLPTISEEEVAKEVGKIKEKITSLGGEVISDEYPKQIKLAYEMSKEIDNKNVWFTSAYFGWVKFEIDTAVVSDVKKMADTNLNFLRFILIKTVRENTLYTPKVSKPTRRVYSEDVAPTESTAESLPINEAEVDKKIEELIEDDADL